MSETREQIAVKRFLYMGRHLRKKARKFRRRVGPLIKRLESARTALGSDQ